MAFHLEVHLILEQFKDKMEKKEDTQCLTYIIDALLWAFALVDADQKVFPESPHTHFL